MSSKISYMKNSFNLKENKTYKYTNKDTSPKKKEQPKKNLRILLLKITLRKFPRKITKKKSDDQWEKIIFMRELIQDI